MENLEKIDYNKKPHKHLKRKIYQFLYDCNEKESETVAYVVSNIPKTYLIVGKEHKLLIFNTLR